VPYRVWATNDIPSAADFNNLHADASSADVATNENSTAVSYGNLATIGPAVTLNLVNGQTCLVTVQAVMARTAAAYGYMSFAVTGSTTLAAADANAAQSSGVVNLGVLTACTTLFVATATGSHTFTAKYKTDGVTIGFSFRRIIVKPY